MYPCKFNQNPHTGSERKVWKSYADVGNDADSDGIRTKTNMSPTFRWRDIKE